MKIFSWMQSKLNGKQVMKKPNTVPLASNHTGQASSKEEFSDWPQSLLAIGTLGITSNLRADPEGSFQSHQQIPTPEEVQEEIIAFLDTEEEEESSDSAVFENRDVCLVQRNMFSRGKDSILVDHKNIVIRKKSLTFLLKKFFTSRNSGLNLVRDSLPDPTFERSRMEKILRAILNKKIHPQSSTSKPMPNKYLVSKDTSMDDPSDDYIQGSTWVKTDSEYIVLEI